ncbi:MAG: DUF6261 family protein [Tannerellaceae bacterium]|nr:DUF6261 family protein [Tannerellaceae bacterium]
MYQSVRKVDKLRGFIVHLRNSEHFELYEEIIEPLEPLEQHKADFSEAEAHYLIFYNLFCKEDDGYKRSLKVEKTAAHRLVFVLDNFKKITSASMVEASALIYNMVQDFRLAKYAPSIAALGLQTAVDKLEACNEEFKAFYAKRELNLKEAEMKGLMKHIRPRVDRAFDNFLCVLEAFSIVAQLTGNTAKAATLGAIINRINATLRQYRLLYLRRRHSRVLANHPGDDSDSPANPDALAE